MNVCRLGTTLYDEALLIQERLAALRRERAGENCLLLTEHPPVITVGRNGRHDNILATNEELRAAGISVYDISRGGDVTYHGPGQIVGYPIADLRSLGMGIREFVHGTEEFLIRMLRQSYGLDARRGEKNYTGVWVGENKIAAIGYAVKKGVTMHGFALNVNTNLEHFRLIVPCGISDRGVTSMQACLGGPQELETVYRLLSESFRGVFGKGRELRNPDELWGNSHE